MLRQESETVIVMHSVNHVGVVIDCPFNIRGHFHDGRLTEQDGLWPDTSDSVPIFSVVFQKVIVGELFVVQLFTCLGIICKVVLPQKLPGRRVPNAVLSPYTFSQLPSGIPLPAIFTIVVSRR